MSAFASNAAAAPAAEYWQSQKQKDFIEGGLKDPATGECRPIIAMPIGKITGEKLIDRGLVYAYQLIGQYMVYGMDDAVTDQWLENEINITRPALRRTLIRTMRKWCDPHM